MLWNLRQIPLGRLLPHHARSKSSKSSTEWLSRQSRDPFVKQRTGVSGTFRARSAFKLLELDDKFKFLTPPQSGEGRVVVDLGGAPGGWSQVVVQRLGVRYTSSEPYGTTDSKSADAEGSSQEAVSDTNKVVSGLHSSSSVVVAVDLLPMKPIPGVHIIQGDFLSPSIRSSINKLLPSDGRRVDVVLSDMAPNISGNRFRDIDLSLELCSSAFQFAKEWLISSKDTGNRRSGTLIMKYFEHPELQNFRQEELVPSFNYVSHYKPKSSRSESSEGFFVCTGFKG